MARQRRFTTFSLSFLDVMSCGFGAVVLIFLMIDHATNVHSEEINVDLQAEVNLLDEDVREGRKNLVRVRNTIDEVDQQMAEAQGLARRIMEEVKQTEQELALDEEETLSQREHINRLKSDIEALEKEKQRLEAQAQNQQGDDVRQVIGDGDRQYLTGLKLGGNRTLILMDASASMLDNTIVNIIRRRNMSDEAKLGSRKWQRTIETVNWLTSQLSPDSWYQIYSFNTQVEPVIEDSLGEWLEISDSEQLEQAVASLSDIIPDGGTSLESLFSEVARITPLPDNIILLTDGLPTQGARAPASNTVTGRQRERFFAQALRQLPTGIPVNVVLTPLEGDPLAASSFWKLAVATGGSFLSPSRDWP